MLPSCGLLRTTGVQLQAELMFLGPHLSFSAQRHKSSSQRPPPLPLFCFDFFPSAIYYKINHFLSSVSCFLFCLAFPPLGETDKEKRQREVGVREERRKGERKEGWKEVRRKKERQCNLRNSCSLLSVNQPIRSSLSLSYTEHSSSQTS